MATSTTNYGWTKPAYEDDADIMVINGTIDAIDAQMKSNQSNILTVADSGGVKNLIPITRDSIKASNSEKSWSGYTATHGGVQFKLNEDLSIDLSGSTTAASVEFHIVKRTDGITFMPNGDYVLSGDFESETVFIGVNRTVGGSGVRYASFSGTPAEFTVTDAPAATGVWIGIWAPVGTTIELTIKPMICTKAAWDVSHTYSPYTITLADLYQKLKEANVI